VLFSLALLASNSPIITTVKIPDPLITEASNTGAMSSEIKINDRLADAKISEDVAPAEGQSTGSAF